MSDRPDPLDERLWESGWEGHSLAQRRRLARLTLIEKLEWLESAHRMALRLGAKTPPERSPGPAAPPEE